MKKKKLFLTILIIMVVAALAVWFAWAYMKFSGKEPADMLHTETEMTTEQTTATTEEADPHAGLKQSNVNGKWEKPELAQRRPVAIMINNILDAIPQSGITKADIIYEALAEGGITRLMAIYEDYSGMDKIGPVRSARHYYVDFADEYNAIYTHFGQTHYATSEIKKLKTAEISGLTYLSNISFYRDPNRYAPHNCYTSSEGLEKAIKSEKISKKLPADTKRHFRWKDEPSSLKGGTKHKSITLGYSYYMTAKLTYSKKDKKYYRYQFDREHIDDQTNKQLWFDNVIIQLVKEWDIDHNGYQTMELVGKGTGYYCTRGKYQKISWKKKGKKAVTRYYAENGKEIKMNPGKTFISVYPTSRADNLTIES
ncbi:MAG: DUF3048 domain-containing protein [Lachnospiraceae bacterium]